LKEEEERTSEEEEALQGAGEASEQPGSV